MKAKFVISVFAVTAALAASAFDGVQVTYRGRLHRGGTDPMPETVSMTFRLYAAKDAAESSWTSADMTVPVNADGLFQVALRGEGLAEAIDAGGAQWIGVSVDGGKEQYPRQELLAAPQAAKAERADALAASPEIGEVSTDTFTAENLSTENVSIAGKTTIPATAPVATTIALEGDWNGASLPVKGDVRFFSRATPRDLGTMTATGGGCSFCVADVNCVALFMATGTDIMPAASMLFKKGETIEMPTTAGLPDGVVVRCLVYPIGVE